MVNKYLAQNEILLITFHDQIHPLHIYQYLDYKMLCQNRNGHYISQERTPNVMQVLDATLSVCPPDLRHAALSFMPSDDLIKFVCELHNSGIHRWTLNSDVDDPKVPGPPQRDVPTVPSPREGDSSVSRTSSGGKTKDFVSQRTSGVGLNDAPGNDAVASNQCKREWQSKVRALK
jgi:hypothetical protein